MTGAVASQPAQEVLGVLRRSHERLVGAISDMSVEQAEGQSYDTEWTIAQVASHLGSGADIFALILEAGITGEPAPGLDKMQPIWDCWNAKVPLDQVRGCVPADAALLDLVDAMTSEQQAAWELDFFGAERTLAGFLLMRLAEHALHAWDILVVDEPRATLSADAAGLIVDSLALLVHRVGRSKAGPIDVDVTTTDPARQFLLTVREDTADLAAAPNSDEQSGRSKLQLSAEAFVRLVYGRLDPDHTPAAVIGHDGLLPLLRAAFPGV